MEAIVKNAVMEFLENNGLCFTSTSCPSVTEDDDEMSTKLARYVTERLKDAGGRMD